MLNWLFSNWFSQFVRNLRFKLIGLISTGLNQAIPKIFHNIKRPHFLPMSFKKRLIHTGKIFFGLFWKQKFPSYLNISFFNPLCPWAAILRAHGPVKSKKISLCLTATVANQSKSRNRHRKNTLFSSANMNPYFVSIWNHQKYFVQPKNNWLRETNFLFKTSLIFRQKHAFQIRLY